MASCIDDDGRLCIGFRNGVVIYARVALRESACTREEEAPIDEIVFHAVAPERRAERSSITHLFLLPGKGDGGAELLIATINGSVSLYSIHEAPEQGAGVAAPPTLVHVRDFAGHRNAAHFRTGFSVHARARVFAAVGDDRRVRVWSLAHAAPIGVYGTELPLGEMCELPAPGAVPDTLREWGIHDLSTLGDIKVWWMPYVLSLEEMGARGLEARVAGKRAELAAEQWLEEEARALAEGHAATLRTTYPSSEEEQDKAREHIARAEAEMELAAEFFPALLITQGADPRGDIYQTPQPVRLPCF